MKILNKIHNRINGTEKRMLPSERLPQKCYLQKCYLRNVTKSGLGVSCLLEENRPKQCLPHPGKGGTMIEMIVMLP